jgi:hypothetical protein
MVAESEQANVREPSITDALIPVVALIVLIGASLALFGTAATDGPLQVALLLAAAVAALVARKNGHDYVRISEYIVGGVSTAMGALFILLAVGALIGTRADRDMEPLRHHRDRGAPGHRVAAARVLLLHRGADLRRGWHGHRQLLDHRGHDRRCLRRHGARARREP